MSLQTLLEKKYLEWQMKIGERKTIVEFAGYLGFAQTTVSSWMNGQRVPDESSIKKIASKLGLEVYDAIGLPRPEENLTYIQNHWDQLSPRERKAIRDAAEQYVTRNKKG